MSRSMTGFVVGGVVTLAGAVLAALPEYFHSSLDPFGGALVSGNIQAVGIVLASFGLIVLVEAAYYRMEYEHATLDHDTPPGSHPI